MKLYVGLKGYKQHGEDKNFLNHNKQHRQTVPISNTVDAHWQTRGVTRHTQRNVL